LQEYGVIGDWKLRSTGRAAPACFSGRPSGVGGAAGAVPFAAAAHGRLAPRPAAARTHRCLRRDPGSLPRGCDAVGGLSARTHDALLPVAAVPHGPEVAGAAPASPWGADARRRPRGFAVPR